MVFGQRTSLWWDLTLEQSLKLVGGIYEVPEAQFKRNLAMLRELLALDDFMGTQVRRLSLGQRVRGDLAGALLYEPQTLYLDEPTVGLDVLARETVRSFIEQVNSERKTTVMLTTHDLADVERLCRRIVLIDRGRILYDGSAQGLVDRYAPYRDVLITLDQSDRPAQDRWRVGAFEAERQPDGKWKFRIQKTDSIHDLMAAVVQSYPLRDLAVVEPRLEEVVRSLYAEAAPYDPRARCAAVRPGLRGGPGALPDGPVHHRRPDVGPGLCPDAHLAGSVRHAHPGGRPERARDDRLLDGRQPADRDNEQFCGLLRRYAGKAGLRRHGPGASGQLCQPAFAWHAGEAAVLVAGGLVTVPVAMLVGGFGAPHNVLDAVLYFVALGVGWLLNAFIAVLLGLTSFWIVQIWPLSAVVRLAGQLVGGATVPLVFFPVVLRDVANALPFQFLGYVPATIYIGGLTSAAFLRHLAGSWCSLTLHTSSSGERTES